MPIRIPSELSTVVPVVEEMVVLALYRIDCGPRIVCRPRVHMLQQRRKRWKCVRPERIGKNCDPIMTNCIGTVLSCTAVIPILKATSLSRENLPT
jgi:hypothetical protein